MARVALWGLGGVPWVPRQPHQRGLRILSLDGGGTKGVCAVAIIAEILRRAGLDTPAEAFDIICGTSTGGIIATLLGVKQLSIGEVEVLYDELIDKIFGKGSNVKLVSQQAFYEEKEWESILHDLCGEALILDSNQDDVPRVFLVSTKVSPNPNLNPNPNPNLNLNLNLNLNPNPNPNLNFVCRLT